MSPSEMRILTVLAVTLGLLLSAPAVMAQPAPVTVVVTGAPEATPPPEPTPSPHVITVIDDEATPEPLEATRTSSTLPSGSAAVGILVLAGLLVGFALPLPRRR